MMKTSGGQCLQRFKCIKLRTATLKFPSDSLFLLLLHGQVCKQRLTHLMLTFANPNAIRTLSHKVVAVLLVLQKKLGV